MEEGDNYMAPYVSCELDFAIGSIVLRRSLFGLIKCIVIDYTKKYGFSMVGVRDLDDDQYFRCYPEQLEYA